MLFGELKKKSKNKIWVFFVFLLFVFVLFYCCALWLVLFVCLFGFYTTKSNRVHFLCRKNLELENKANTSLYLETPSNCSSSWQTVNVQSWNTHVFCSNYTTRKIWWNTDRPWLLYPLRWLKTGYVFTKP